MKSCRMTTFIRRLISYDILENGMEYRYLCFNVDAHWKSQYPNKIYYSLL